MSVCDTKLGRGEFSADRYGALYYEALSFVDVDRGGPIFYLMLWHGHGFSDLNGDTYIGMC